MILAYAFALHTLIGSQVEAKEIPILRTRPSRLLAKIETGQSVDNLKADDVRSVIVVTGSKQDIADAQSLINLFDVAQRQVRLKLSVDSKIDKLSYQCDATIANYQAWRTNDDQIGISTSISPRINDDNTITLFIQFGTAKHPDTTKAVVRVKIGESVTFSIGKNGPKYIYGPNSENTPKLGGVEALDPQVKITAGAN